MAQRILAFVSALVIASILTGAKIRNIYRVVCIPTGGAVDNLQQGVENWIGEEKAKIEVLRFAPWINYGR